MAFNKWKQGVTVQEKNRRLPKQYRRDLWSVPSSSTYVPEIKIAGQSIGSEMGILFNIFVSPFATPKKGKKKTLLLIEIIVFRLGGVLAICDLAIDWLAIKTRSGDSNWELLPLLLTGIGTGSQPTCSWDLDPNRGWVRCVPSVCSFRWRHSVYACFPHYFLSFRILTGNFLWPAKVSNFAPHSAGQKTEINTQKKKEKKKREPHFNSTHKLSTWLFGNDRHRKWLLANEFHPRP